MEGEELYNIILTSNIIIKRILFDLLTQQGLGSEDFAGPGGEPSHCSVHGTGFFSSPYTLPETLKWSVLSISWKPEKDWFPHHHSNVQGAVESRTGMILKASVKESRGVKLLGPSLVCVLSRVLPTYRLGFPPSKPKTNSGKKIPCRCSH